MYMYVTSIEEHTHYWYHLPRGREDSSIPELSGNTYEACRNLPESAHVWRMWTVYHTFGPKKGYRVKPETNHVFLLITWVIYTMEASPERPCAIFASHWDISNFLFRFVGYITKAAGMSANAHTMPTLEDDGEHACFPREVGIWTFQKNHTFFKNWSHFLLQRIDKIKLKMPIANKRPVLVNCSLTLLVNSTRSLTIWAWNLQRGLNWWILIR